MAQIAPLGYKLNFRQVMIKRMFLLTLSLFVAVSVMAQSGVPRVRPVFSVMGGVNRLDYMLEGLDRGTL